MEGEGVNGVDEGGWRELGQERSCLCVQPLVRRLWLLLLLLGGGGGGEGGGGRERGREGGREGGSQWPCICTGGAYTIMVRGGRGGVAL